MTSRLRLTCVVFIGTLLIMTTPASAALPAGTPPRVLVGAHHSAAPHTAAPHTAMASFNRLETAVGRLDVVHYYQAWGGAAGEWDRVRADGAAAGGRRVLLTWEPWDPAAGVSQPGYSHRAIVGGEHDAYLRRWAEGARDFGRPLELRLMHEMNGNWYPWAGGVSGNTAQSYVAAWRHVHGIFRDVGASNVRFVWSANADDVPAGNKMEPYYPGRTYVDLLALDGYNWGVVQGKGTWRSYEQVFASSYARVTRLGPQQVWITETASATSGGDKAGWVRAMLASRRFPRVTALVWFDVVKERDWSLTSSAAVTRAFRDQRGLRRPLAAR